MAEPLAESTPPEALVDAPDTSDAEIARRNIVWAWSLFTNFVCYALMGLMFAGEYAWRRWKFRHLPHPGFAAFVRFLVQTNPRSL